MLQIISAKGRKMDANTIAVLDELLKVYPEDYWLNFIKNLVWFYWFIMKHLTKKHVFVKIEHREDNAGVFKTPA